MNKIVIKKRGAPFTKKVYPAFPLSEPQFRLIEEALDTHGGIEFPMLGLLVRRKMKARRHFNSFAGRVRVIKPRVKLHIITDKNYGNTK